MSDRFEERWKIEVQHDGTCDVFRNDRVIAYDRDDLDEAMREVRRSKGGEVTEVTVVEVDGYRHRVRL